jgi:hypothetical protein
MSPLPALPLRRFSSFALYASSAGRGKPGMVSS